MAVGTLNVAVTASTRKAQQELQAFRREVKATGEQVKRSSGDFSGNTLADYTKRFGGGPGSKPIKPPTGDLNTFRSAVVDLTRDTKRYNGIAREQIGILKEAKMAVSAIKSILPVATLSVGAFYAAFKGSQRIGQYAFGLKSLAKDAKSLEERLRSAREALLDPGLSAAKQRNADGLQRGLELQRQREADEKKAREEAERQRKATIASRLADDAFRARAAAAGQDQAMFERDEKEFGRNSALRLLEARQRANAEEAELIRKKEAAEAKAAAAKERQKKLEEEAERKRKNQLKDEEAVAQLRRDVAEFGWTSVQRQRAALMRSLEDPRLREQARGLFSQQDAQQRAVVARNRIQLLAQTGGMGLSATAAGSREGFAQRVRFGNQNRVDKIASDQLKTQRQMEAHLRTLASRAPQQLEAANIGGG